MSTLLASTSRVAISQAGSSPVQNPPTALPSDPSFGVVTGLITDTQQGAIPGATIAIEDPATKQPKGATATGPDGSFTFASLAPGTYRLRIKATGFASWKVEDIVVHAGETVNLTTVELGVESLDSMVDAISVEDLAEQQITAEEHQRILGILPNFYVSYLHGKAAPLTSKQKFKLAFVVSTDPLTFFTTGVNAGIEQAQNDFADYGQQFKGYALRYGAAYGDRVISTFLGAAALPSLLHQDPRYFYNGEGGIVHRALYAISTVVICKGDNGKWQPNYSNVLGNLGAGLISSQYYPKSSQHSIQVTVDNTLIGIGEGSIGTLFQEFLLRRLTHGAPPENPRAGKP
jgi:hypothetical protein